MLYYKYINIGNDERKEKMLFDSHAHINSDSFSGVRDKLVQEIEESDLSYVMDVGYDLASSVQAIEHAAKYQWCYAAVGCHPHDAKTMDEETLIMFKGLSKKPKVKAIGEIGLDYHYDHSERDVQRYWFRRQIQLALEVSLPIIIHDREANDDVLSILKEENAFKTKVLLHCYSGSAELAKQYVKLGAEISIAGPVTYKNARKLIEVVETIPIEHLLAETDAPYLTPEPLRGKKNSPVNVIHTIRKIAVIKNIDFLDVAQATCNNAKRFFDID